MNARIAMWSFIAATFVLHAVVAWMAPLSSDDWEYVIWAAQHRHDATGDWFVSFIVKHRTLGDLVNYAIARHPLVHCFVTPALTLAVVWATFTIAMRRLPRFDAWADVGGIVVIAAFLWIAAPRCGLDYFHRPYAATWLCGTAFTLWFLVPFRCGWRPRGGWLALLVIVGLLAGSSTRQLGVLATVATIYALRKSRQPWMYVALAAVVVGTLLGFHRAMFDFRGFRPGFELSLTALNLGIWEAGELMSLVAGFVLTKLVIGALWPKHAGDRLPDTSETLRWFGIWIGFVIFALFGPRYAEPSLYPAAVLAIIAVWPVVTWIMSSRPLKIAMLAIAVGINVVAWGMALRAYVPLGQQYRDRMETVRAAPKNSIPTVKTYRQIRPSFWAYGEDWHDAARRQYIATALFKLEDIQLSPAFRRLELNPNLALRLVATGVTDEELRAAGAPEKWAGTLKTARAQFDFVRRNLRGKGALKLVVEQLPADILNGRELLAATEDLVPRVNRRQPDDESRQALLVTPTSVGTRYPDGYRVIDGKSVPLKFGRGRYLMQALTTELHAVIACNPQACFLVDAFIPSL
jgi:Family of unknown function (DUF6056)